MMVSHFVTIQQIAKLHKQTIKMVAERAKIASMEEMAKQKQEFLKKISDLEDELKSQESTNEGLHKQSLKDIEGMKASMRLS